MDQPADQSWVVAIVADGEAGTPIGSGVLIGGCHVVTARHVVDRAAGRVWVAFPTAEPDPGERRRERRRLEAQGRAVDAVVIELGSPAPAGARPVRIRAPSSRALAQEAGRTKTWWASGFARGDLVGHGASGTVGAALGRGMVLLNTVSRHVLAPAYAGAGIWSPDYDAVVAIVVQADRGDARALTLHQIAESIPEADLSMLAERFRVTDSGTAALAEWGWSLVEDDERREHRPPRARAVPSHAEQSLFRGRRRALAAVVGWLQRASPDERVLVVTGSPGVGKSAVLGRVVTSADPDPAVGLPEGDAAVRARSGLIACAVHAKGKTALDVATEVARAASAELPARVDDAISVIRTALNEARSCRFNVVIDGVDEAVSTGEAKLIVTKLARPLAEACPDVGARVVLGARRRLGDSTVQALLGRAHGTVDLDDPELLDLDDLRAYCLANLLCAGDTRRDNPYWTHAEAAEALAAAIAERAAPNFLVAGLISRTHGLSDTEPFPPGGIGGGWSVADALGEYVERIPAVAGVEPRAALTALAFADAPGFTAQLWSLAVGALYGEAVEAELLGEFARSAAASFLIRDSSAGGRRFRLFHQALDDALLHARSRLRPAADDEARLVRRLSEAGRTGGWEHADEYLLRNLATHAERAGAPSVDELLDDDEYLLNADLRRLARVTGRGTGRHHRRCRLVRLAGGVNSLRGGERAAQLSILDSVRAVHTGIDWPATAPAIPYWVTASRMRDQRDIAVHSGHTTCVQAVCAFELDGRPVVASAGLDGTVRVWSAHDGRAIAVHTGHTYWVRALCAFELDGRPVVASADRDAGVRVWDPRAAGTDIAVHTGHTGSVWAVCAFELDGRPVIASADHCGIVRVWDPRDATDVAAYDGHSDEARAMCAFELDGRPVIASADHCGIVRVWDPRDGSTIAVHHGHFASVNGVCAFELRGRPVVASAGDDRSVRVWDPRDGSDIAVHTGHTRSVSAMCAFELCGRPVLASASDDGTVRVWDASDGTDIAVHTCHPGGVRTVCAFELDGRPVIASAGSDRAVRVWDPGVAGAHLHSGQPGWVVAVCALELDGRPVVASAGSDCAVHVWDPCDADTDIALHTGHPGGVVAVCAFELDGRPVVASAGSDGTVRVWNARDGTDIAVHSGHTCGVLGVCGFALDGAAVVASAGIDGTVRVWNASDGTDVVVHSGHRGAVFGVCALELDGRPAVASAGMDHTVRVWDAGDGTDIAVHTGHTGSVEAVCAFELDGRPVVASAGSDRTVRVWDARAGTDIAVHGGHSGGVSAVCALELDGRPVVASAGHDGAVRVWDLGGNEGAIPVHASIGAVAAMRSQLLVGLDAGVLVLEIRPF